jgi:molybdate transport repressor ModE-like protein
MGPRGSILYTFASGSNMMRSAYMKLTASIGLALDRSPLDARLLGLLARLRDSGSLAAACRECEISYRHGWGMVVAAEHALGQPVAIFARGRGAALTALGEALVAAHRSVTDATRTALAEGARALASAMKARAGSPQSALSVQASHDLALAELRDLAARRGLALELRFVGSLDGLDALARGQCDVAGFHVPDLPADATLIDRYRPWLRRDDLVLLRFATRTQGLMVAPGNPLAIRAVRDLARRRRFVNRQPGSGTRLLFDHLLAQAGLRPAAIHGYAHEEFTHAAVAATVASGMADAGFGIEAAARQQGLAFVPVVTEHYYLAARRGKLARPAGRQLVALLRDRAFLRKARALPGYNLTGIGDEIEPRSLLPSPAARSGRIQPRPTARKP